MQDVFDTFTIIMVVLALLIFWKLRSVLGIREVTYVEGQQPLAIVDTPLSA